jgi:ketosteroid isomerase-like protein
MAPDFVALMRRNLLEVFDNRDGESRRAAILELFTEDCIFCDPHGRQVGHGALDRAVVQLHDGTPGFVFSETGAAQAIPDAGRLGWSYGPAGRASAVTGEDLVLFRDGKIAALYTFLDEPTS